MSVSKLVRVQYVVFVSLPAALAAGYPDAEFGVWQPQPGATQMEEGWIALDEE